MNGTTVIHIIKQLLQHLPRYILLHLLPREYVLREIVFDSFTTGHLRLVIGHLMLHCSFYRIESHITHNFDAILCF